MIGGGDLLSLTCDSNVGKLFDNVRRQVELAFDESRWRDNDQVRTLSPRTLLTFINSIYWATFSFTRVFTVMYIDYIGAEKNIILQLSICMLANVFLLPFGNSHAWCLWAGNAFKLRNVT